MHRSACILLILAVSAIAQSNLPPTPKVTGLPPAAEQAMAAINPENIRWQTRFLSHDLLEGRGTGQRGGDVAAEYIGTQFALYGLKPAGDNGSYLQKVPMMGVITQPDSTFSLIPSKGDAMNLRPNEDIVAMDETGNSSDKSDL